MREKIREVIGDVRRGSQHEALRCGVVTRVNLHVRSAFRNAIGDVEREAVALAHEAKRLVARILRVPFLHVVAERRALPHVRARDASAVGHIEHLAGRNRGNRVVALAHRLNAPPLEERAVRRRELDVGARVNLRASRGERRLQVRSSRDHVHTLEGLLTCGFTFACSSTLACGDGLRGLGLRGLEHGRRDGTGAIRLCRCCKLR